MAISATPVTGGRDAPGTVSVSRPATATASPAMSNADGRSPPRTPAAIIVVWTAPKSVSAPMPAPMRTYANVKATA